MSHVQQDPAQNLMLKTCWFVPILEAWIEDGIFLHPDYHYHLVVLPQAAPKIHKSFYNCFKLKIFPTGKRYKETQEFVLAKF